ncbi:hypothetical protein [Kitasatospora xanthocidica]|uniref:hypothetical protein n=1 Tax=Kitasatospora xanthocidica TaxID=83382 RepID=UPI0016747CBD|nr:hypothetical protein [Kitasatospora xanthocidica]
MTGSIEQITALIEAGADFDEIRRRMLPAGWEPLLKACAAAGVFDRELFDRVLRPSAGPGPPGLDRLVEREVVEPAPGEPGRYRLSQDDRAAYMKLWLVDWAGGAAPRDLAKLERRLAEHRAAAGDRREQLRHLLVGDRKRGLRLFDELFTAADTARDFARCQDLLDVLADDDRLSVYGPEVARVREDRAGYVRARCHWAVDYARCAQYLARPELEEQAAALLAGTDVRAWQLHGAAGMGKTTRLRWLVTRYCAGAERDVPCARIDFDVVSPVTVGRYPWLALLEAAAQFDDRWGKRTFGSLDRYASFRSLLGRRPSDLSRTAAQGFRTTGDPDTLRAEVTRVFVDRFNDAAGDRPALLVCDTTEELLLRGTPGVGRFLALLGEVQQDCPALRIVLAGRYDLATRAPEALAALKGVESIEVTPFTDEQAETYLRTIRGIADPGKRAVARRRANGRPLVLALFADAIELDPDLGVEALEKTRDPVIPPLIERVVCRITEEPVRWLLRYGVVPRKLRREDLAVMAPFLRNMAGPTPSDDPRADTDGLGGPDAYPFTRPPGTTAELDRIWAELLNYAGSSSWVSQAAEDPSTVVFHPDVLVPQRLLLADHPVFEDLHRAFARHFELLAEGAPDRWAEFTREALYHRFQPGDPQAAAAWRSALRRARQADALDELHELACEVLGGDYLDEDGTPRRGGRGTALITHAEVAEARLQEAYVLARRALRDRVGAGDPQWDEVEYALEQAARARDASPRALPVPGGEHVVRAMLLNAEGRAEAAVRCAEHALTAADPDERLDALRVLGDSRAAAGDPTAQDAYQEAFELALREGKAVRAVEIGLALARDREAHGRLDEALRWCERLEPLAPLAASPSLVLARAGLLLACRRPCAALRVLRPLLGTDDRPAAGGAAVDAAVEAELLRARAAFMLGREERARTALDRATLLTERVPGAARYRWRARIHQLGGVLSGELLGVEEAERYFQQAESLWQELGYHDGHPTCRYLHARFLLRDVGDLVEARELLAAAGPRTGPPAGRSATPEDEFALRTALLARELVLDEGGRPDPERPTAEPAPRLPPRQAALLATQWMVEDWRRTRRSDPPPRDRESVQALAHALEALEPPSARLFVLDELRRCRTPRKASDTVLAPLYRVFPAADDAPDPLDRALHRALLAELDRLAGRPDRAHSAVDEARAVLQEDTYHRDPLQWWRWFRAGTRLGVPDEPARGDYPSTIADRFPLLHAAVLAGLAKDARRAGDAARAGELITRALEASARVARPTRWAADALRTYAELADDPDARSSADRLYQRLGRPQRPAEPVPSPTWQPPQAAGQLAIRLTAPDGLPSADTEALQRLLFNDPGAVVERLREPLAEALGAVREPDRNRVLRLESDDAAVHALPWELAVTEPRGAGPGAGPYGFRTLPGAAEHGTLVQLQTSLRDTVDPDLPLDGFLGPRTRRALALVTGPRAAGGPEPDPESLADLARQRQRPSTGTPTVVIVAPPTAVQYGSRGSHRLSGVALADVYASFGFTVRFVEAVDSGDPLTTRPSLVHVSAPLEATPRGPYFDMSVAYSESRLESRSRGFDLPAAALAEWLRVSPDCVVVLDPPVPGSPLDIPEQMLWRNQFAAQLFARLPAAAVLGIGLNEYHTYASVAQLATAVRDRRQLADAFHELVLVRSGPVWEGSTWRASDTTLFATATTFADHVLS